jgi:hypothetical protein
MLLIVRSLKAGVVVALVATAFGVDLWQIVLVSVLWSVLSSVEDRYSAKAQIAAIDEAFTDEVDGWTQRLTTQHTRKMATSVASDFQRTNESWFTGLLPWSGG